MLGRNLLTLARDWVPGFRRVEHLPRQVLGLNPFNGDIRPTCVPVLRPGSGRPCLPFPHPWNYDQPIRILETFFWGADDEQEDGTFVELELRETSPPVESAVAADGGSRVGVADAV